MAIIQATIFFDRHYWVGVFERTDRQGYSIARHIFGGEPADAEIYSFVLSLYAELKFGPAKEIIVQIHRMNPKRVQREVRREMARIRETAKPSTFAQDYMREEMEKKKILKKKLNTAEKQARKDAQFDLKQKKKKDKQRGH